MSVKETAEYLRSPQPSIYFLIKNGKIPAFRIGGRWKIKRRELDEMYGLRDDTPLPKVLIVEDDAGMQSVLRGVLQREHIGHQIVDNGAEAIQLAHRQTFDLVILDLKLPDLGGDEVFIELRKVQPDVPVVIITGYPDSDMLSRILSVGPVIVLKKPIEPHQLENVMSFVMNRNGNTVQAAPARA